MLSYAICATAWSLSDSSTHIAALIL